jgi:hypothetical protein
VAQGEGLEFKLHYCQKKKSKGQKKCFKIIKDQEGLKELFVDWRR